MYNNLIVEVRDSVNVKATGRLLDIMIVPKSQQNDVYERAVILNQETKMIEIYSLYNYKLKVINA